MWNYLFYRKFLISAMLFSGRTNAIYLTREYYQDYACAFDLAYYPFDTQVSMVLLNFAQFCSVLLNYSTQFYSISSVKWCLKFKAKLITM